MNKEISIESLLREVEAKNDRIRNLETALHDRAVMTHAQARQLNSIEHRGAFDNCPSPACVNVRVLLGQEGVLYD